MIRYDTHMAVLSMYLQLVLLLQGSQGCQADQVDPVRKEGKHTSRWQPYSFLKVNFIFKKQFF